MSAHAQPAPQVDNSPICHVNPAHRSVRRRTGVARWGNSRIQRPLPTTGLLDEDIRELEEFGNAAIVTGKERQQLVAFTFDDGPKTETTPRVLDALDRYDVPATFFVVGWRYIGKKKAIVANRKLLREILTRGHVIGNHTYKHENLTTLPTATMQREIDKNTDGLVAHLGYRPHLFRPPYGAANKRVREHLQRENLTEIRWNIDTQDFQRGSYRWLRKRTMTEIVEKKGGVVLLHDTKEVTAKYIASILDDLEAENCNRLRAGGTPIIPVSIHYFIHNRDGTPRPVPPRVRERTERYRANLPGRCKKRPSSK